MRLFILGTTISFKIGDKQIDGWVTEGTYITEKEAIDDARPGEMLIEVDDGRFPENATDAIKLYWPLLETWEQSTLYKQRYSVPKLSLIKG